MVQRRYSAALADHQESTPMTPHSYPSPCARPHAHQATRPGQPHLPGTAHQVLKPRAHNLVAGATAYHHLAGSGYASRGVHHGAHRAGSRAAWARLRYLISAALPAHLHCGLVHLGQMVLCTGRVIVGFRRMRMVAARRRWLCGGEGRPRRRGAGAEHSAQPRSTCSQA